MTSSNDEPDKNEYDPIQAMIQRQLSSEPQKDVLDNIEEPTDRAPRPDAYNINDAASAAKATILAAASTAKVRGADTPPRMQQASQISFVPVRQSPKGTKLVSESPGSITVSVKAVIRLWWVLALAMIPITVVIGLPIAFGLGLTLRAGSFAPFNISAMLITTALFVGLTFWAVRATQPRITITATPEYLLVHGEYYDRRAYRGMRLGYEINGDQGMFNQEYANSFIGLQALRLRYGKWGEDLPYLIDKYHAPEIVTWLNMMISKTQPTQAKPSPSQGTRTQRFES